MVELAHLGAPGIGGLVVSIVQLKSTSVPGVTLLSEYRMTFVVV